MDSAGHVALTDLGISAKVEARPPTCTQTSGTLGYMVRLPTTIHRSVLCNNTPHLLPIPPPTPPTTRHDTTQAPEIFWEGHLHGIPSEAYSLGVLLHELSTGARPYPAPIWERLHHRGDPEAYHRSCEAAAGAAGPLFKGRDGAHVPGEMQTLVRQLLQPRPERRGVGAEVGGLAALKAHAAFAGVDWEALASKTADPPFVPPADANVQASAEELFGGGGGDDFGGGGGGKAAGGGGGGGGAIPPSDQALFESYSYDYRDPPPSPSPSPSPHSPGISLRRSFVRLSLSGSAKGKGSGRFSFIASGSVNTRRSSSTASTGGCLSPATPGSQPPPPLTASSSSRRLRVAPEEQEQREEHQGVEALPSLTIPMPEALTLLPAPEESEQEGQEPQQPPQPLQPQSLAGEEVTAGAAVVGAAEGRVDEPLALPVGEGVEVDGGKGAEAVVELTAAPEGAGVLPVVEE